MSQVLLELIVKLTSLIQPVWVIQKTVARAVAQDRAVDINFPVPFILYVLVNYLAVYNLKKPVFH